GNCRRRLTHRGPIREKNRHRPTTEVVRLPGLRGGGPRPRAGDIHSVSHEDGYSAPTPRRRVCLKWGMPGEYPQAYGGQCTRSKSVRALAPPADPKTERRKDNPWISHCRPH